MRIVSLVPSQTELLYTLGLDEEVVGITKFCIHPSTWFHTKTRVGGTKNIHPEIIDALHPDLILANKEENDRQQIEDLATRYPVWVSNVQTLPDALDMILTVGKLTNRTEQATVLAAGIEHRFNTLSAAIPPFPSNPASIPPSPVVSYFIWRNPYMAAGGDTFIHDMLTRCGFTNHFAKTNRYPIVNLESLPENITLLLSSEPYPFKEKHIREIQAVLPHASIHLVDGQIFSWYGSRLLEAPAYFSALQQELTKRTR